VSIASKDKTEQHAICTNRFIQLANELKNEKIDSSLISGALMTASAVYATYAAAGNQGGLEPSGMERIVDLYRRTLEHHQQVKRQQLTPPPQAANDHP